MGQLRPAAGAERGGLRQQIEAKRPAVGLFYNLPGAALVEMAGWAGFDFVVLDTEHGPLGFESVHALVAAAEAAGTSAIVRVTENEPSLILRALDSGAAGIVVPQVEDADGARRAVESARFPPAGRRGFAMSTRSSRYGLLDLATYMGVSARALMVCQVETARALENLDDIAGVPGVDIVYVGPSDLAQSLGFGGRTDDPSLKRVVADTVSRLLKRGARVGLAVPDGESAARWAAQGVVFLAIGACGVLGRALRGTVAQARAAPARGAGGEEGSAGGGVSA